MCNKQTLEKKNLRDIPITGVLNGKTLYYKIRSEDRKISNDMQEFSCFFHFVIIFNIKTLRSDFVAKSKVSMIVVEHEKKQELFYTFYQGVG